MEGSEVKIVKSNNNRKVRKGSKVIIVLNKPLQVDQYVNIDNAVFQVLLPPKRIANDRYEHVLKTFQAIAANHITIGSFVMIIQVDEYIVFESPRQVTDNLIQKVYN